MVKVLSAIGSLGIWVAASSVFAAGEGDSLEFSGSFWDRNDSFVLRVDFGKNPAELSWDGFPDPAYAWHLGMPDRKAPKMDRVVFTMSLSDEEDIIFRRIWHLFHHCDPGPNYSLGTGLLTRVTATRGDETIYFSYFAPPRFDFLARAGEALPIQFQEAVGEAGIDAEGRKRFLGQLSALDQQLLNYEKALLSLEAAMKEQGQPDWNQVWAWIKQEDLWNDSDQEPEEETPASVLVKELPRVLDAYSQGAPEDSPNVYFIDSIGSASAFRWGGLHRRGPQLLRGSDGQWGCLPVELKFLIEDFVEIDPTSQGPYEGRETHAFLELYDLSDREKDRLKFIEASGLDAFLLGREDAVKGDRKVLYGIGIDPDGKVALIHSREGDESFVSEWNKDPEGQWKFQQFQAYETWARQQDEESDNPADPFDDEPKEK